MRSQRQQGVDLLNEGSILAPLLGCMDVALNFISETLNNNKFERVNGKKRSRSLSGESSNAKQQGGQVDYVVLDSIFNLVSATLVFLFTFLFLKPLRLFLDYPVVYMVKKAKRDKCFYSPDGKQALQDIHLTRDIVYMNDPRFNDQVQRMDKVSPLKSRGIAHAHSPIVYFHGGGHICVNKEILLHSITPFAREGFSVYAVAYPLSPEYKFPIAILTGLRAICEVARIHCRNNCTSSDDHNGESFVEVDASKVGQKSTPLCEHCSENLGVSEINIVGDSAGGNLASMLTLVLSNPSLVNELINIVEHEFDFSDLRCIQNFPKVNKLVSMYGLLSREIGESDSLIYKSVGQLALKFLFSLYDPHPDCKTVLCDYDLHTIEEFAEKSLFLCGTEDPLYHGNISTIEGLKKNKKNFNIQFITYAANHAFHGLPVRWAKYWGADWKATALKSTYDSIMFLTDNNVKSMDPTTFEKLDFEHFDVVSTYVFPVFLGLFMIFLCPVVFVVLVLF